MHVCTNEGNVAPRRAPGPERVSRCHPSGRGHERLLLARLRRLSSARRPLARNLGCVVSDPEEASVCRNNSVSLATCRGSAAVGGRRFKILCPRCTFGQCNVDHGVSPGFNQGLSFPERARILASRTPLTREIKPAMRRGA